MANKRKDSEERRIVFVWGEEDESTEKVSTHSALPEPEELYEVDFHLSQLDQAPRIFSSHDESEQSSVQRLAQTDQAVADREPQERSAQGVLPRGGKKRLSGWKQPEKTEGTLPAFRIDQEVLLFEDSLPVDTPRLAKAKRQTTKAVEPEHTASNPTLDLGLDPVEDVVTPRSRATTRRKARLQNDSKDDRVVDKGDGYERIRFGKKTKAKKSVEKPSLFARAVGYLSRREYAKKELRRKLIDGLEDGETIEMVDELMVQLEKLGYLSEERFARSKVRQKGRALGNFRLRTELRQQGVSDEAIQNAFDEELESEEIRAYRVWSRRFDELPSNPKERDKQIRYLQYRGFSMSSIQQVIRGRVELPEEED